MPRGALSHPSGWRPRGGCQRRGPTAEAPGPVVPELGDPGEHGWFAGLPPSPSLPLSLQMEGRSRAPSPSPCRSSGGCWSAWSAASVSTALFLRPWQLHAAVPAPHSRVHRAPGSWGVMGVSSGHGTWTLAMGSMRLSGKADTVVPAALGPSGPGRVSKGGRHPAGRVGAPHPAWAVGWRAECGGVGEGMEDRGLWELGCLRDVQLGDVQLGDTFRCPVCSGSV